MVTPMSECVSISTFSGICSRTCELLAINWHVIPVFSISSSTLARYSGSLSESLIAFHSSTDSGVPMITCISGGNFEKRLTVRGCAFLMLF